MAQGNYSNYPYRPPTRPPSPQRRRGYAPKKKKRSGKAFVAIALVVVMMAGLVVFGAFLERQGLLAFEKKPRETASTLEIIDENEGVSSAEPVQEGLNLLPLEKVKCQSYIVIDKVTGKVILEYNSNEKVYPASVTKIMTALVAAENGTPDQIITASQNAIESLPSDASMMGLLVGEQTTLNDLLYGLMLPSGCDAANVIAEGISGSMSRFVDEMNQKAKELGCKDTHFANPSGLHDEALYSTSADLAKITAAASCNALYSKVVSANDYAYATTNKHSYDGWRIAANTNRLLGKEYLFGQEGMIVSIHGGKTGSHSQGGFNLACTATAKNGTELVAVINNIAYDDGKGANFLAPYMAALLNAAAKAIDGNATTYLTPDQPLPAALVPEALPEQVILTPERAFSAVGGVPLLDNEEDTSSGVVVPDDETARQITAGEIIITFTPDMQYALKIKQLDPGEEKRVGYITVTDRDGNRLCRDILVNAKYQG